MRCECEALDARACWAVRNGEIYLWLDRSPRCGCACHLPQVENVSDQEQLRQLSECREWRRRHI
jgi:hypothetical protein